MRRRRESGGKDVQLVFQNEMVLAVVQALVGAISEPMHAVSIYTDEVGKRIDLHVAITEAGADIEELVDEIVTDIVALTAGAVFIEPHVWIGSDWTNGWPGQRGRMIYAAFRG